MARTRKRSDGRYDVRMDIGTDESGKRIRKHFYGKTRREAEQKRDAYIESIGLPEIRAQGNTVSDWAGEWMHVYNADIAPRTRARKEAALRSVLSELGDRKLGSIKAKDLQSYLNTRAGKSRADISLHKSILRGVFDTARQNGLIAGDPCDGLRSPKAGQYKGHRALTKEEQQIILEAAQHHRAGLWALLMMCCGLRREEMAALRWEDVQLDLNSIWIHRASEMDSAGSSRGTKTEAGQRSVPIPDQLRAALECVPVRARHGLVCTNASGGPLSMTSYRQGWRSFMLVCLRVANGIRPYSTVQGWRSERDARVRRAFTCTAHDLRYTYATALYDIDVDVKTMQYVMGHTDFRMTLRIYTQLSDERKRDGLAKVSDSLSSLWASNGRQSSVSE